MGLSNSKDLVADLSGVIVNRGEQRQHIHKTTILFLRKLDKPDMFIYLLFLSFLWYVP